MLSAIPDQVFLPVFIGLPIFVLVAIIMSFRPRREKATTAGRIGSTLAIAFILAILAMVAALVWLFVAWGNAS